MIKATRGCRDKAFQLKTDPITGSILSPPEHQLMAELDSFS